MYKKYVCNRYTLGLILIAHCSIITCAQPFLRYAPLSKTYSLEPTKESYEQARKAYSRAYKIFNQNEQKTIHNSAQQALRKVLTKIEFNKGYASDLSYHRTELEETLKHLARYKNAYNDIVYLQWYNSVRDLINNIDTLASKYNAQLSKLEVTQKKIADDHTKILTGQPVKIHGAPTSYVRIAPALFDRETSHLPLNNLRRGI